MLPFAHVYQNISEVLLVVGRSVLLVPNVPAIRLVSTRNVKIHAPECVARTQSVVLTITVPFVLVETDLQEIRSRAAIPLPVSRCFAL